MPGADDHGGILRELAENVRVARRRASFRDVRNDEGPPVITGSPRLICRNWSGRTGFGPATLSLGKGFTQRPGVASTSQVVGNAGDEEGAGVQSSQPVQGVFRFLATALLPEVASGADPEPLLTVRQVARRLGVSRATVYRLCARGELPHVRVLNALRIPAAALAALMPLSPGRRW